MLTSIDRGIQNIAEAIASALHVNVTIVDSSLKRVAGTGPYLKQVKEYAPQGSAFVKAIENQHSIVIENPGNDPGCHECEIVNICKETFEICAPVIWQNEAHGVIGIFAIDENQKTNLKKNRDLYLNFLQKMADLLASKFSETFLIDQISTRNRELNAIIQNVSQGVVCIDSNGIVKNINEKALALLNICKDNDELRNFNYAEFWPDSLLLKAIREEKDIIEKEERLNTSSSQRYLLTTVKLITLKDKVTGAVATYTDSEDIQRSALKVSTQSNFQFEDLIGKSVNFIKAKEKAQRAANYDSTILIMGESGTGKELFARSIHNESRRVEHSFVGINCSAIPENLLESELFGYDSGAFTGASVKGKIGKMEMADKGTLFLDEIGDMPLYLQAKLLRVLQERTLQRVGGIKNINIDIRVIAATNKNLEELIKKKMFREDLYYRLCVVPLTLPPLRDRKEDIPVFIDFFLDIYNKRFSKNVNALSPRALDLFLRHSWPGNVRELENIIEYGINFAENQIIDINDIRDRFNITSNSTADRKTLKERTQEYERQVIVEYLNQYGWNEDGKDFVAKMLGLSRSTLFRKLSGNV